MLVSGLLWLALPALAGTPKASSELKDSDGEKHPASYAFDGVLGTAWGEGEAGAGKGSWVEVRLDRDTVVRSVSLWPGDLSRGERSLREFGRPHTVTVTLTTQGGPVSQTQRVLDPVEHGPLRVDVAFPEAPLASAVRVTIDEAVAGGLREDLYVAEVAVNFVDGDQPPGSGRLEAWLASEAGQAEVAKDRAEVDRLVTRIQEAEFGDKDALEQLMARAGDGAPWLRKKVALEVEAGFRVQALPPDLYAVDALLKLEDSNAIPAIERAALRARGASAKELDQKAQYVRAFQELVGGGRRSLPAFGTSGWERGALRGLGEPLDVVLDAFGGLWVADVANHRVQRFTLDGVADLAVGNPTAGVTSVWFGRKRELYATGSRPGVKPGEFVNPVALARVPGKVSDRILVLDTKGRVSTLEGDGTVAGVFTLPVEGSISPAVGGEGHLVYLGGKLLSVFGNEAFLTDLEGTELGRFKIQDGAPTGAIAVGSNRVGLTFGDQVILYGTNGFRYGEVMRGALGEGFESFDLAYDEKGKLWAVTDQGRVVKFKRMGVVDFEIQVAPYSLEVPRLAVVDSMVFVVSGDTILKADILELQAKAEEEAAP